MFTRLSNTHTVCLPPERDSLGLGRLHQHISNMLRPAFSTYYYSPQMLSGDRGGEKWGGGVKKIVVDERR